MSRNYISRQRNSSQIQHVPHLLEVGPHFSTDPGSGLGPCL